MAPSYSFQVPRLSIERLSMGYDDVWLDDDTSETAEVSLQMTRRKCMTIFLSLPCSVPVAIFLKKGKAQEWEYSLQEPFFEGVFRLQLLGNKLGRGQARHPDDPAETWPHCRDFNYY